MKEISFKQIGIIRTPYQEKAPYQPIKDDDQGIFQLIVDEHYIPALNGLEKFKYIFVLSFLDRIKPQEESLMVSPPWVEPDDEMEYREEEDLLFL
jgi:tRNA (Thr-GGU) A37 N-methylase